MKPRLKERLAYWFDNYMASGAWSIFLALLITFILGFLIIAGARVAIGYYLADTTVDGGETFWRIFLELTDPGNMNQDNPSQWLIKVFAIISGIFGIIFFSAVIAFITTQLELKLESLKKGKSRVLEQDHVLILGWSTQIVEIIRELIVANESESRASVVLLSLEPKEEMDDFLNDQITDRKTTKIITRNGETSSLHALGRVGITNCKSVIILPTCSAYATDDEKALSDAHTLKTLLAVVAATQDAEASPSIVSQVFNKTNRQIMENLSPDNLTIVDPEDMVAKIAVQTSRSSGLAAVYTSLIGFEGCEFYMTNSPWNGKTFGEIQFHYPDGIALGVRKHDGSITMNPLPDYRLEDNDDIIILAEDDSTINFKSKQLYHPQELAIVDRHLEKKKEKELIIGWNNKGRIIIEQYIDYIMEGSSIDIALQNPDESILKEIDELKKKSPRHSIQTHNLNMLDIASLATLQPETYNSIIILNTIEDDIEKADANTINILLLLREVIRQRTASAEQPATVQIISEVMNSENLELITHTGVNDAIISTKMVSKILAQIAEEPDVLKVYDEIFREDGSEIYLKPLSLYFDTLPEKITFADIIKLAQKRNEVCLGYRKKALQKNVEKEFGIVINPPKDSDIFLEAGDSLIVLAEDEL